MSHARIEEVSDSDPDIDDPAEFLPDEDDSIIAPAIIPTAQARAKPAAPAPEVLRPQAPNAPKFDRSQLKTYQTLYPVYFDSARTRAQGRRVSSKLATPNPLARTIVDAVSTAVAPHPVHIAFEPDKIHPKDWSNPGRIRVQLLDKTTGKPLHPSIKKKSHLYILVAKFLQKHPTQPDDPKQLQIQGLETPTKLEAPAKPRGWKINDIIPYHSPAMTGGGVNDNFMGDMMKELQAAQGQGGGGAGGQSQLPAALQGMMNGMGGGAGPSGNSDGGGTKKKKEKKKG